MVNGFRYYTALESVSIASALSTALTIYPCQIRVLQRWQSKLQLPTARKKGWRPATADSSPHAAVTCQHCDTHCFSRPRTRNLPIVGWLLVRRTTSSATDSSLLLASGLLPVSWTMTVCRTRHQQWPARWSRLATEKDIVVRSLDDDSTSVNLLLHHLHHRHHWPQRISIFLIHIPLLSNSSQRRQIEQQFTDRGR